MVMACAGQTASHSLQAIQRSHHSDSGATRAHHGNAVTGCLFIRVIDRDLWLEEIFQGQEHALAKLKK